LVDCKTEWELGWFLGVVDRLKKIGNQLHKIAEKYANTQMDDKQTARLDRKEKKLIAKAKDLAHAIGLQVYHQTDCRGKALYLVPDRADLKIDGSNYNSEGVCL
jgi:hypothetical protein